MGLPGGQRSRQDNASDNHMLKGSPEVLGATGHHCACGAKGSLEVILQVEGSRIPCTSSPGGAPCKGAWRPLQVTDHHWSGEAGTIEGNRSRAPPWDRNSLEQFFGSLPIEESPLSATITMELFRTVPTFRSGSIPGPSASQLDGMHRHIPTTGRGCPVPPHRQTVE